MANRYWVGGAGTWNTSSTTNWSATSGGASGASVPTAADSVFFDQAGTYTVTCTGALNCLDFTVSAGTVTFNAGTSPALTISGSMSLVAGTVWNIGAANTLIFNATTTGKTITTNGVTLSGAIRLNGVGGGWTLGSALTIISTALQGLSVLNGSFDTGGYNLTAAALQSNTPNAGRSITLNASTLSLTGSNGVNIVSTGLTFNAGTSQINLSNGVGSFDGDSQTFYNVAFTSSASTSPTITGANTFNNLSVTGRTTVGIGTISIYANQTINGTLTLSAGTASAYRTLLRSDTFGTQRTLTCAAFSGGTDFDFRDINIAGAASPISPTRAGDCKGNNGITFPAAKTVYYRQTGSNNWGTSGTGSWSATSGGALDAAMFPLTQDTAVFPAATYPASGSTTSINANYGIGTIDMSLRTSNTMTLATGSTTPNIYGNWINGTGTTISGTGTISFTGRTTQQITSAGRSFTQPLGIVALTGTVQLQDAFTTSTTVTTTLSSGTLDLQSYTLSTGLFNSSNSNTRTIAFGTGQISCTGTGTVWTTSNTSGLTTTGTQVVNVTSTGSTAITVTPGVPSETNSISYNFTGGTYALSFLTGSGSVRSVDYTGYAGTLAANGTCTIYGNLKFSTGMTLTASGNSLVFGITSGTQQITTNGKTLDFLLNFNGVGGTFQLQDALTMGSTKDASLVNGTLDLNGKTMTVGTRFRTNLGTKNLTFNGGTLVCPDPNTTSFNNANPTGFTTTAGTGTGTISMTAATAKTFVGGGSTYNCTLNQGGIGTLTVSGNNTFSNLTNTVNLTSVLFTGGTTNIFTNFNLTGALVNLVTLGSTNTTQATLQKGSTWFMGASSTDAGNNTGLTFTAGGGIDYLNVSYINGTVVAPASGVGGNFLMFF
jgi:fibronectin-binding autotransporter adhesin